MELGKMSPLYEEIFSGSCPLCGDSIGNIVIFVSLSSIPKFAAFFGKLQLSVAHPTFFNPLHC